MGFQTKASILEEKRPVKVGKKKRHSTMSALVDAAASASTNLVVILRISKV
jgi:hypothetical protein